MPQLKLGNLSQLIFANFQNCAYREKYFKDNESKNLPAYCAIIYSYNCPRALSVPHISQFSLSCVLRKKKKKIFRFLEQIMYADNYPSIFSHQIIVIMAIVRLLSVIRIAPSPSEVNKEFPQKNRNYYIEYNVNVVL